MSGKNEGLVLTGSQGSKKPKSFLDVVSIVENYFLAEQSGENLPENLLTLKGKVMVSEVGFKGAAVSALVSIFLTPFCVGVIEKYIPIFGSYDFSLFDQCFALALTLSFSVGYSMILASIGKFYVGTLTRRAVNWLMTGLTMAGFLKIIAAFFLYHTIYASILDADRVANFLMKLHPGISYETLDKYYKILMGIKPILLISSNFVILTTLLMITVPWGFIFVLSRRTKKQISRAELWK